MLDDVSNKTSVINLNNVAVIYTIKCHKPIHEESQMWLEYHVCHFHSYITCQCWKLL